MGKSSNVIGGLMAAIEEMHSLADQMYDLKKNLEAGWNIFIFDAVNERFIAGSELLNQVQVAEFVSGWTDTRSFVMPWPSSLAFPFPLGVRIRGLTGLVRRSKRSALKSIRLRAATSIRTPVCV